MHKATARVFLAASTLMAGCSVGATGTPPGETVRSGAADTSEPVALPRAYTPTPTFTPLPTLSATPVGEVNPQAAAMLPAFAQEAEAFSTATRYWIEVEVSFDDENEHAWLDGVARIQFTNPTSEAMNELIVMLWPNDDQYAAAMTVDAAMVDGVTLEVEPGELEVSLHIPLREALPADGTIDVSLPFRTEVESFLESSPRRFGIAQGVLIAPTFYPLIPPVLEGEFQVEAAPAGGDTTNSEISFYTVTIHVPDEFAVAATGVEVERTTAQPGVDVVTFVTGPVRDFAFAVGPLESRTREVGNVLLRAWALQEHERDLSLVLDAASAQMKLLGEWLGPYPYVELDLVDAPGAFGGIEYPGLVYLGTLGSAWIVEPTVHEVAHQWFYGLIGNDQLEEPWLDEAAATYAEALYYEAVFGPGRATSFLAQLRAVLRSHPDPDQPIGLPVGAYQSVRDYSLFVYFKGALFFDALRQQLGEEAFRKFLASYFDSYRYSTADGRAFQRAAESACACSLDELFDVWVYVGGETELP